MVVDVSERLPLEFSSTVRLTIPTLKILVELRGVNTGEVLSDSHEERKGVDLFIKEREVKEEDWDGSVFVEVMDFAGKLK